MRRVRVWAFSLGDPASVAQQQRIIGPLSRLPAEDFDFVYAPSWPALLKLGAPPDIAVFHRNFYPFREARKVLSHLRRAGGRAVLDLDDLITEVPESHPSHAHYKKEAAEIVEMIRAVDLLTVTNARLKERYEGFNPRVAVLPNLLDETVWSPPAERAPSGDGRCVVVYAGAPQHARDLALVEPALKRLSEKYGDRLQLRFIGCLPAPLRALPNASLVSEVVGDYRAYARLLQGGGFDLAIVPLGDEAFNSCKSNIKFIEFSGCGIPGVYSDVGPYRDSVSHGRTGWLAPNTTEAWLAALERLIEDPGLRRALGRGAAASVWKDYALRDKAVLWRQAYAREAAALKGRARLSAAPFASYGPYLAYALMRGLAGPRP